MYSLGTSVAGDWELVWRVRERVYCVYCIVWELVWRVRDECIVSVLCVSCLCSIMKKLYRSFRS